MRCAARDRVQDEGVGFRYFTQSVAMREGIAGWARNLPDGRVEIVGGAEPEALERFERQIRQGPRGALVDRVEVSDGALTPNETGFFIR